MKKRLITFTLLIIILAIGIIIFINQQNKPLNQPLISPEEDEEVMVEESDIVDETNQADEENVEDSFSNRISVAIQETIDKVFSREVNIVAIGDSLTRGVGDESDGGGYVGILERSINHDMRVATFQNFGVPGNRTDQLLARLDQEEIQNAIGKADLVLITIGANDIMQVAKENITNLEIEDFVEERQMYGERLKEILEIVQGYNSRAEIYLLGIYNPFEKYFEDIDELNLIVEAWNDTGHSLTLEDEHITFVPVVDLFKDNEEDIFADDNFHPNYQGYYLMAQRVLQYISGEEG